MTSGFSIPCRVSCKFWGTIAPGTSLKVSGSDLAPPGSSSITVMMSSVVESLLGQMVSSAGRLVAIPVSTTENGNWSHRSTHDVFPELCCPNTMILVVSKSKEYLSANCQVCAIARRNLSRSCGLCGTICCRLCGTEPFPICTRLPADIFGIGSRDLEPFTGDPWRGSCGSMDAPGPVSVWAVAWDLFKRAPLP